MVSSFSGPAVLAACGADPLTPSPGRCPTSALRKRASAPEHDPAADFQRCSSW
jgi:hypothetical protein